MTNQTTNQNSNWDAIGNILSTLAEGKSDMEMLFTPIYICNNYDNNGFCESHITDDEAYAGKCDSYELVNIKELNDVVNFLGKVFDGVLLTSDGLCQFDSESNLYNLLIDNSHFKRSSNDNEKYKYKKHLYNDTENTKVETFITWLVDKHHYSREGVPLAMIRKYIDTVEKISEFYSYFEDMYKSDSEYLNACLFETINLYRNLNNS